MRPIQIVMQHLAHFDLIYLALRSVRLHFGKNLLPMAYAGKIIANDAAYLWPLLIRKYAKCIWIVWRNRLMRWKNIEKVSACVISLLLSMECDGMTYKHVFIPSFLLYEMLLVSGCKSQKIP